MRYIRTIVVLVALFVGSLALRLWARDWGLPYVEHPDEPALLRVVVRMLRDNTLNPHTFIYPSFYYYLLTATLRIYASMAMAQGQLASLQALPLHTDLYTTMPGLYIWGRSLSAVLGALAAPFLAILAHQMFGLRAAILGGVLMMTCAYHIEHSHYVTVDAMSSVMVIVLLIGAWRIIEHGDWPAYLLAGLGVGLSAAVKYNTAALALVVIVAHVLAWRRAALGWPLLRLITAGVVSIGILLCTTPYALLDWSAFSRDLKFSAQNYASVDQGDFVGRWRIDGYARFVWNQGLFPGGVIVLLLGLPFAIRRWPRQMLVLITAISIHVFLLMLQMINFVRNILPIVPALLLLAAAAALALADVLAEMLRRLPRWRLLSGRIGTLALKPFLERLILPTQIATVVCAGVLILTQVQDSVGGLIYWSRPYTLVALEQTLRSHPQGMRTAVEMNPVQWSGNPVVFPVERVTDHTADWYRAHGYRYLVVNNDHRTPADQVAYQQLIQSAQILQSFSDRDTGQQPGPGAALLDLGEHVEQMSFVRRQMRFGGAIDLLGYELQPGPLRTQIEPLDSTDPQELSEVSALRINLYWRTQKSVVPNYILYLHVIDDRGQRVAQRDLPLRAYDYPTSQWRPGELVVDMADLPLPALPPGVYQVKLGLYDNATGTQLQVITDAGNQANQLITLWIH